MSNIGYYNLFGHYLVPKEAAIVQKIVMEIVNLEMHFLSWMF